MALHRVRNDATPYQTQNLNLKLRELFSPESSPFRAGRMSKKVFSPTLEQALTFLDDTLLPATSNAVERGNRRYRKRQKSVYRVHSKVC